ncbi:AraC family transcriptional regulator [Actinoplanes sp. NPDC051861]|uniref:AraC family transcriptional regulator n=1 Tax=Actinoplanes sp. NPDC051861 TaxID=3155170 RepID=UPI00342F881C
MDTSPVISVRTDDLDEAREICGTHLYPRSMRLLEPGSFLDARFAFMHLDVMTLADVRYGAAMAGVTSELGCYHVNVPQAGRFYASQGGRPISGTWRRAAVYQPVGDTALHWSSADCHLHALKIDRWALEAHLEAVFDVRVNGCIRLAGQIDIGQGAGRTFNGLVRLLGEEMANPDSLLSRPAVAEPVKETLMTALLLATDHQYRDTLRAGTFFAHVPARSIGRVVDAIHDEPSRPHTLASLAAIGRTSSRRLHTEFLRQHGVTPMAYLRDVRLLAAHADLVAAEPGQTSVPAIARRWGFLTSQRFTLRYRARFHESPAATLHS